MILPGGVYLGYLVSMWWITAFPTVWDDTPCGATMLPGVWLFQGFPILEKSSISQDYGGVMSAEYCTHPYHQLLGTSLGIP